MNKSKLQRYAALLMPLAVGIFMLALSWQRWPDIITDFGREAYIPWQINCGKLLYRDIAYLFGPLSAYMHALVFKIFGTGILTLAWFNVFLIVALSVLIFKFFSRSLDRVSAHACLLLFLTLFAFSQYVGIANYNYVCPYTYTLTHGILISFAAIYVFLLLCRKMTVYRIALLGILCGLAFLTKPEIFLALIAAVVAGLCLLFYFERMSVKRIAPASAVFFCGLLTPLFICVGLFCLRASFMDSVKFLTQPYSYLFLRSVSSGPFYRDVMGLTHFQDNIIRILFLSCWYIGTALIIRLSCFWVNPGARPLTAADKQAYLARSLFLLLLLVGWFYLAKDILIYAGMPLPLIMAALLAGYSLKLWRLRMDAAGQKALLPLPVMALFALLLLAKIIFYANIFHIGFALAMPAALVAAAAFTHYLPLGIQKARGNYRLARILCLALLVVVSSGFVIRSCRFYLSKTYAVGKGPDLILDYGDISRGALVNSALNTAAKLIREGQGLVVFPEGAMFNYLSRRSNPTGHLTFLPAELNIYGEAAILAAFISSGPDYIVVIDYPIEAHGYNYFCQAYGGKLYRWIKDNYLLLQRFGKEPFKREGFGIEILYKKLK